MKILTQNDLKNLILGSSLLATGGGGSITSGYKLIKKIKKSSQLVTVDELKPSDIVITVFGVGGQEKCNSSIAAIAALEAFQNTTRLRVSAIIPVEIGPLAVIEAFYIASLLKFPVLDADIVGYRSSPEIFLETISIPNLSRVPLACANDKGDALVIYRSRSMFSIEKIARDFAVFSGGDALIVGYPLKIKEICAVVGIKSIDFSIALGKNLSDRLSLDILCKKNDFYFLGKGKIIKEIKSIKKGFTVGKYVIEQNDGNIIHIFIKNENIVLTLDNQVILTTPDLICLLNLNTYQGINNFENNKGKTIAILGKKALPIWRKTKGKKLFHPKNLGLNFEQKLL